ncbi:MAG: DapH/DapD/GlmU-related protein [Actinomycetota bacterium]
MSAESRLPDGLKGDVARLFSSEGTHGGRPSIGMAVQRVLTRPGPLAIGLYRGARVLWLHGLHTVAELVWRLNYFLTGADIHPGAEIGGGLRLTHTSGIVIGKGVKIGSNVSILHEVTMGGSARANFEENFIDGFPDVGDDCKIYAGAKLLGPIKIGRGCFIGANAVVTRDLPEGTVYTAGARTAELKDRVEQLERELASLKKRLAARED